MIHFSRLSVRFIMALRSGKVLTETELTVGKAPGCHPIGSQGNDLIGTPIANIPVTRKVRQLPTGKRMLRYFQYHHKVNRHTKNEAAKITEEKMRELYNATGIEMMSSKEAVV